MNKADNLSHNKRQKERFWKHRGFGGARICRVLILSFNIKLERLAKFKVQNCSHKAQNIV